MPRLISAGPPPPPFPPPTRRWTNKFRDYMNDLQDQIVDWLQEEASSNNNNSTTNNGNNPSEQLYSQLFFSSLIGVIFLSIHVMASCSFGWHFQQAFSTVEGTFLYILRGLVMLFSLMNVYWMTMTQWKEYTLEFVDPKNSLYSPNAKKLPKIEEPRQEPAEKSEETSENTASNKAEKKTKNKFTIKPIVFERQSLRIWQPPFSAICMACSYSPLHFLLIELLTFNSESSLTSTPSSSASSSVIPSLSLVILLISLSVVLLWTSLQFYTSLKDRDILFQQVMREYNMKFVYPTLTKLSEKQALLDRLEKQKEEIQKSQVEIPEPLTEKNPFFKTPPPEELEEPEQSSTTKKKKHRKHIVEQPESTKEDRSTRAKKRTPGSQRISQRTPGSKKEPLK